MVGLGLGRSIAVAQGLTLKSHLDTLDAILLLDSSGQIGFDLAELGFEFADTAEALLDLLEALVVGLLELMVSGADLTDQILDFLHTFWHDILLQERLRD